MRNYPCLLLAAGLSLAVPALAAPAPVEVRVNGNTTELAIETGTTAPELFQRDQCGALLVLSMPEGLDVSAARTGGGRIRGVGLVDAKTLTIATDCGSQLALRRVRDRTVLTVSAPPLPGRKPLSAAAQLSAATVSGAAGATATSAAPVPPTALHAPLPVTGVSASAAVPAGGPASPAQTAADAAFARSAIAKGLHDAEEPPAPPQASAADTAGQAAARAPRRDLRIPDPGWGTGAPVLDLAGWRRGPFLAERDRLRQAAAADAAQAADARRDLIRFQLAWGMAPEALAALEAAGAVGLDRAVAAVSATLADPTHPAADWLLTDESLHAGDGPLWAAVLLQRRGRGSEALKYLPAAGRALPQLPPETRRLAGFDLLAVAADAGLDGMAREFARQIEGAGPTDEDLARLFYEIGRLHAVAGRMTLALAQWDKAAARPFQAGAKARLAAVDARLATGDLDSRTGAEMLELLVRDWPESPVEAGALFSLARIDAGQGHLLAALDRLRLLHRRFPDLPPAETAAATDLAGRLLGEMAGSAGESLALADRILTFERSRDLLPDGKAGWDVRRRYAALLREAGIFKAAEAELQGLMTLVPATDKPSLIVDLARLQLAAGDPAAALAALDGMDKLTGTAAALKAQALTRAGDLKGALALVSSAEDADGLQARAAILWRQERWADAAGVLTRLEAKQPLTAEDAARLALASLLTGDGTTAARVLTQHEAALGGETLAQGLQALARPVPVSAAGERDLRQLLDDSRALGRLVRGGVSN